MTLAPTEARVITIDSINLRDGLSPLRINKVEVKNSAHMLNSVMVVLHKKRHTVHCRSFKFTNRIHLIEKTSRMGFWVGSIGKVSNIPILDNQHVFNHQHVFFV